MKVTFVLPGFKARPAGGFLVVYRYANELSRRGHEVRIIHPRRVDPADNLPGALKAATWRHRKKLRYSGGPPWFELDRRIEVILVPDLREGRIPPGDAIFATACNTAPAVWSYSSQIGAKLYLVQGYEDWLCNHETLNATWRLPMHKVVSSNWLYEIGVRLGERSRMTRIPIGVELDIFRVVVPPSERSRLRVGILAHTSKLKGMTHGIEALRAVKRHIPDIDPVAFGVDRRPGEIPAWMAYVRNPSRDVLSDLYNSLALFLHTSEYEGWGLPGAEALACGCALVAADSGGIRDYAVDGRTALVVPTRDPVALASATTRLVEDSDLRLRLADAGSSAIQRFTWDRAAESLDAVLKRLCGSRREGTDAPALSDGISPAA